jgi:hypothetical protein
MTPRSLVGDYRNLSSIFSCSLSARGNRFSRNVCDVSLRYKIRDWGVLKEMTSSVCTLWRLEMEVQLQRFLISAQMEVSSRLHAPDTLRYSLYLLIVDRDSSVSIATRYGLDGLGIESRGGRYFQHPSNRPWGVPSSLHNRYRVPFPGVKRPRLDVNHSTPSSAEVKEKVYLYLYSRCGSSWPVWGWTCLLIRSISSRFWGEKNHLFLPVIEPRLKDSRM